MEVANSYWPVPERLCSPARHPRDHKIIRLTAAHRQGFHHLANRSKHMQPEARSNTVVLIHGLWMTPLSWEHWVARYEQRGMRVVTPGYPGIEPGLAGVEALRKDPTPLAGLGVREVFDHLAQVLAK